MLPLSFLPVSTMRRGFYLWRDNRLRLGVNHTLLMATRAAQGSEGSPSLGVIPGLRRGQRVFGTTAGCQAGTSNDMISQCIVFSLAF